MKNRIEIKYDTDRPTVRNLIDALMKLPLDTPVAVADDECGIYCTPLGVTFDDDGDSPVIYFDSP